MQQNCPEDESRAFRVEETISSEEQSIAAITIADIMKMMKSDRIDILKLNIEGAEKELFEANYESWLNKVELMMVALHDPVREGCSTAFYRAISKYDFKQLFRGEHVVIKMKHY